MANNKNKSMFNKIIKVITNIFFYFIIVFLLVFSFMTIASSKPKEVPSVFGYGFLAVMTDSMIGDNSDSFDPGTLLRVKILNDKDRASLKKGDVVTFYDSRLKALNTHRIVEDPIIHSDGRIEIQTRGDKYDLEENREGKSLEAWNDPSLDSREILALYKGKINKIGGAILWVQTEVRFAVVVVLPIFIMFMFQGAVVISNIHKDKNEHIIKQYELDKEELLNQERERIRQEVINEYKLKEKELDEKENE